MRIALHSADESLARLPASEQVSAQARPWVPSTGGHPDPRRSLQEPEAARLHRADQAGHVHLPPPGPAHAVECRDRLARMRDRQAEIDVVHQEQ